MSLKEKAARAKKPLIGIAVVESDPVRFAGFHALFDSEPDFELISASLPNIVAQQNIGISCVFSRGAEIGSNLRTSRSKVNDQRRLSL
jgi:hypothetical protein